MNFRFVKVQKRRLAKMLKACVSIFFLGHTVRRERGTDLACVTVILLSKKKTSRPRT